MIKQVRDYLAFALALLVLVIFLKNRVSRWLTARHTAAGTSAAVILLLLPIGTIGTHLEMPLSADEASMDIVEIQQNMLEIQCSIWNMNEGGYIWENNHNFYAVDLACSLSQMKIKCPCSPLAEFIPIARRKNMGVIGNHTSNQSVDDEHEIKTRINWSRLPQLQNICVTSQRRTAGLGRNTSN